MPAITIKYTPPVEDPEILYIDKDLIVVNKPAGLLSVPGRGDDKQDCLISRIQCNYPEALIVHRLDLATSGILILARSPDIHRDLSQLFQNRKVSKEYTAVVSGIVSNQTGAIDLPLFTDWPNRPMQKVDYENGKPSLTHYEVLQIDNELNTTRLKLIPITGRSHQLRVHLLSIGHVIIGDGLYSDIEATKNQRMLLHSNKIEFLHPCTHKLLTVDCHCPF